MADKQRDTYQLFSSARRDSALTATRQAIAFETLASLSGHGESIQVKLQKPKTSPAKSLETKTKSKTVMSTVPENTDDQLRSKFSGTGNLGLTVRIEINLPAQGDQDTYDRIFQSIKKNLLNG